MTLSLCMIFEPESFSFCLLYLRALPTSPCDFLCCKKCKHSIINQLMSPLFTIHKVIWKHCLFVWQVQYICSYPKLVFNQFSVQLLAGCRECLFRPWLRALFVLTVMFPFILFISFLNSPRLIFFALTVTNGHPHCFYFPNILFTVHSDTSFPQLF